jgi:hypothetical protein
MKHYRFETDENFSPLKKEKKLIGSKIEETMLHECCPFGDPHETRSFPNVKK